MTALLTIAVATLLARSGTAQVPSSPEHLYQQAVAQPGGAPRVAALENVVERAAASPLRTDALELLVWEYAHSNPRQAGNAARELLKADGANPLAIAVLKSGTGITRSRNGSRQEDLEQLTKALESLHSLHRPRLISDADFTAIQRWAYALLSGSAGMAYFQEKDYESARPYLRNALAVMPDNVTWSYSLALADLEGSNQQSQVAFEELARAVVLTEGTSEGRTIGEFASAKYAAIGGTPSDWSKYLQAARANTAKATGNVLPQIALVDFDVPKESVSQRTAKTKKKPQKATSSPTKGGHKDTAMADAINRDPAEANAPHPPDLKNHVVPFPPGEPVSLGILLEGSIKKENREDVIQGLSDVVRRLRKNDEAFVLAFGNELAFEQDLTQNYRLLERAVDEIKPDSGAALYDAIAFSAGHLKRIAKNRNQALLVISDGRNGGSRQSSLRLASAVSDVKIYCIGVDAATAEQRYALQALANYTGGQAAFVTTADQFEPVLLSVAQAIYGPSALQQSRR